MCPTSFNFSVSKLAFLTGTRDEPLRTFAGKAMSQLAPPFDIELQRTQTTEMNKHDKSFPLFVSSQPRCHGKF